MDFLSFNIRTVSKRVDAKRDTTSRKVILRRASVLMIIFSIFVFCSNVSSETIVLKSGKSVRGKVVGRSEQMIKVDVAGEELTFFPDEIKSIDGAPMSRSSAVSESKTQALSLTIELTSFLGSGKKEFETLESLDLEAILQNNSQTPLIVAKPFYNQKEESDGISIRGPQGHCRYLRPPGNNALNEDIFQTLGPGSSIRATVRLNAKEDPRFSLVDPGRYEVVYKYTCEGCGSSGVTPWQGSLTSNTVVFNLVKGEGVITSSESLKILEKFMTSQEPDFYEKYVINGSKIMRGNDSEPYWVWFLSPKKPNSGKPFSVWINKNTGEGSVR